ncbi:MAG: general secretion pathway protein G [Planctomycetota bacterium]|jgi:general secretion pathway protein G
MIVVAILAIIASIGVPQYVGALRTARVGKAKHELVTISQAIDSYTATNSGQQPLSLYQVGFGGKRDPWGVPYCYLNYSDGTGDGLDWAIAAGIVDPSAFAPLGEAGGGGDGGPGGPQGVQRVIDSVQLDYMQLGVKIGRTIDLSEQSVIEQSVMTNGNFSFFSGVPTETTRRVDRYMFPLNTDYDLFSLGPDHQTAASLGESVGMDDVIRANNGGFFGLASNY